MDSKLKTFLLLVINLIINGTIWLFVPIEYKVWVLLVGNLIQVYLSFIDPTYTLQKLGMGKREYLGRINKTDNEIKSV